MRFSFVTLAAALSSVTAAPALVARAASDAAFSVTSATVQSAITCPRGISASTNIGGIVFLIHGTGTTGDETWTQSPYNIILPMVGEGYDICWIDLPNRALTDAQLSAEYVARGVSYLAPLSATGKVSIIAHSQGGGLNVQWALTFWPSIQSLVSQFIALAPDFHGTVNALVLCSGLTPGTCVPSLWQQTVGSKYLAAQNSLQSGGGGRALVKTTSIYTVTDEIVQPQLISPSSRLTGATVQSLQSLSICGPLHIQGHFGMIVDSAAFGLAKASLLGTSFNKRYCSGFMDNVLFDPKNLVAQLEFIVKTVIGFQSVWAVAAEPSLQPYVCDRGFASKCGTVFTSVSAR